MDKERLRNLPQEILHSGFLYTLACLALAIVLLVWKEASFWGVYITAGAMLSCFGIWKIWKYFVIDGPDEGMEHQMFAQGAILLLAGILMVAFRDKVHNLLPLIMASALLFVACLRAQAAIDLCRRAHTLWYLALAFAGLTALAGLTLLIFEISTHAAVIMLGIALLLEALCDLYCRLVFRRLEKYAKKEAEKGTQEAAPEA